MAVSAGDHFGFFWNNGNGNGGLVAFDWLRDGTDNLLNRNYCGARKGAGGGTGQT